MNNLKKIFDMKTLLYVFGYFVGFVLLSILLKIPITVSIFVIVVLLFFIGIVVLFDKNLLECSFCKATSVVTAIALLLLLISIYNSPIFHTKSFASLIKVEEINATKIINSEPEKVRKVTKKMALMKANKILGRKINGVEINTQYEIEDGYIIKYKNKQYWIFPLQYSGFLKWLNQDEIPGYILISAIDPYAKPIFVNKTYKYAISSYFTENVKRIFLIKNKFMPVSIRFEIDENKEPYWIGIGLKYKYLGQVFEVDKIFIMNAKTGEIKTYMPNNVPEWVDVVYPEKLINNYIEYYGKYRNGFMSFLTGNNVIEPTSYDNKELWLVETKKGNTLKWFTGMSSKNRKDNSLSSVILVDAKTLKAYIVEDTIGIMDESGAIDAINAKLGVNSIKWTAVLPMAYIKNNKWFWVASIIDKKTYFYQKEGIVDGKNPNYVKFGNSLDEISIETTHTNNNKKNKRITKKQIYNKIIKIQNELNELKNMIEEYKGE
jgi:hypothetical protein